MNVIDLINKYIDLYQTKIYSISYRPYLKQGANFEKDSDSFFQEYKVPYKEVEKYLILRRDYITQECNKLMKREREKVLKAGGNIINPKRLDIIKEKVINELACQYINEKIDKENEKLRAIEIEYKAYIKNLNGIIKILTNDYPKIDVDEIDKLLLNTDISAVEKLEINSEILDYVDKKEKEYYYKKKEEEKLRRIEEERKNKKEEIVEEVEEIIEEEKTLKNTIRNFEYIEPIFTEYSSLIPDDIEDMNFNEGCFELSELKEILNMKFKDIDEDLFLMVINSVLYEINTTSDITLVETYKNYFEYICKKYQLNSQIEKIEKTIKSIYTNFACSDEDTKLLSIFQNEILKFKDQILVTDDVVDDINKIENAIFHIRTNNLINNFDKNRISIKSFILFDYDSSAGKIEPYITTDLDGSSQKTTIDASIDKSKIVSNGYNDFNELIEDLLIFGNPRVLTSQNDKLSKIVRPIYNTNSSYEIINKSIGNSTGMYRIRPHTISNVRFIDEKIKLIPNTEKFLQIKELLESKLPNIYISDSEPFDLYINYLTGFKLKDFDSYKQARNRQENSEIRSLLRNKANSFSSDELELLSKIIDATLCTYKDLEEINENFSFKMIDKLKSNQILN